MGTADSQEGNEVRKTLGEFAQAGEGKRKSGVDDINKLNRESVRGSQEVAGTALSHR